jgi:hypothetical protein
MSNRWTALALHEELASFYYQFKGVAAPANLYTQSLWTKIEEVEAGERA